MYEFILFKPLAWVASVLESISNPIREMQMRFIFGDDFPARKRPCSIQKFASHDPLPK